jgi:hypothetical protein
VGSKLSSKRKKPGQQKSRSRRASPASGELTTDIRASIEAVRLRVAQTVNAELLLL